MSAEQAESGARRVARLEKIGIPRLLFALLRARFTGRLEVMQLRPHAGRRSVWLRGGMPVFTDWISEQDRLGQILVEHRWLEPQRIETAARDAQARGELLGHYLAEARDLPRSHLTQALREQCVRKMTHWFALKAGEVLIIGEEQTRPQDDDLTPVNTLELLRRGVLAHYDEARIASEMGAALEQTVRTSPAFARYQGHFGFVSHDQPIVRAMVAGTSLGKLVEQQPDQRRRIVSLIYLLWAAQMLAGAADGTVAARSNGREPSQPLPTPPLAAPKARDASDPMVAAVSPPRSGSPPAGANHPPSGPAAQPAAKPAAADNGAFEAELADFEARLARKGHAFELLGISITSGKREVRAAWSELSRKFHPDGLQSRGLGSLRQRVEEVFAALSEAHMVLNDQDKRRELRDAIEAGVTSPSGGPDATALARAAIESEIIAKEGDKCLKAGKFDMALSRYAKALDLTPDEPDLGAAMAWCEYQMSPKSDEDGKVAVAKLDAVLEGTPNLARAHYFRGMVLMGFGNEELALASFSRAQSLDPRLIEAERQARAIRMRKSPPNGSAKNDRRRFGIKGLFGSKK